MQHINRLPHNDVRLMLINQRMQVSDTLETAAGGASLFGNYFKWESTDPNSDDPRIFTWQDTEGNTKYFEWEA